MKQKTITYIALCLIFIATFGALKGEMLGSKWDLKKAFRLYRALNERGNGILVTDTNNNLMLVDWHDDMVSKSIWSKGVWEPHVNNLINNITHPGQNIAVLGGHLGFHAVNFSKLAGKNGMVYCFEPNPKTLKFLSANLFLNESTNTTIFNKAAFNENKILRFEAVSGNTGMSKVMLENTIKSEKNIEYEVQAVKLDDALKDVKELNILMMDIEGSEPFAVYGAQEIIDRSPNLIVLQEWVTNMMASLGSDIKQYLSFWTQRGYKIAKINNGTLEEVSEEDLLKPDAYIEIIILAKDLENLKVLLKDKQL